MSKKKVISVVSGVVMLLIVSIGLSFAYFTASLQGSETETTITVTGGTLRLVFDGGNNITVGNIYPRAEAVASKTFTVTGNNTTTLEMPYVISLVVDSNTFSENALSYTLTSTNTSGTGTPVPSIIDNIDIPTGTGTYLLGSGVHLEGTGKIHTYILNIYFLDTGEDQNSDQGKTFQSHIGIESGETLTSAGELLIDAILNQEGGAASIASKPVPDYSRAAVSQATYDELTESTLIKQSKAVVENGIYSSSDEYGTSYYYRGEKTLLNNNLIFAGFQWKIVRINGDESIRIIYNGECPADECEINIEGIETQIEGESDWNITYFNDNKYSGFMYGGATGEPSTCRDGVGCATANETNSDVKAQLDNWYANNIQIQGSPITSKIADNIFCNDRQIQSEIGGEATGPGFGAEKTMYASFYRIYTINIPTLKCGLQNDRYTVSDLTKGNGALEYPVGLLSVDEATMAGLIYGAPNTVSYLHTTQGYWTLSPFSFSGSFASLWNIGEYASMNAMRVNLENGIRPVLNLKPETRISGEGTILNPYKVI